ncbi:hypothetical protein LP419_03505 [Massilia sp. H-1]|nr:hypothetical protein LP419_03505 [Massilia sp. H-1]
MQCSARPRRGAAALGGLADPLRIGQVLDSLLEHALAHSAGGHTALVLMRESEEGGVVRVRFTVSGSGAGVSEADGLALCQPYSQAAQAAARPRRQRAGTGDRAGAGGAHGRAAGRFRCRVPVHAGIAVRARSPSGAAGFRWSLDRDVVKYGINDIYCFLYF